MIERIIEYSMRNPFLVVFLALVVAGIGIWSVINTPVDAIPDLSENQVIVFTDWPGRSPQEIEDQVTYPLSVNLQGLAGVKAIRATSEFGFSMINIIFEDKIDFYFARQRVLERLSIAGDVPAAGRRALPGPRRHRPGPDLLVHRRGRRLRPRPAAGHPGLVRPLPAQQRPRRGRGRLRRRLPDRVPDRRRSRTSCGPTASRSAKCIPPSRGRTRRSAAGSSKRPTPSTWSAASAGFARSTTCGTSSSSRWAARRSTCRAWPPCSSAPSLRRASLEKNGNEAVGGVVLMRYGENPLEVTKRIKDKIEQLQAGLPPGVRIVPFYDRTALIDGAIDTVTGTLREEMIVASLLILLVLWHVRSALVICITLPLAVLDLVHPDALAGHPLEHHVALGHRHFDRRPGRFVDRDGRERDPPAITSTSATTESPATPASSSCRPCRPSAGRSSSP